MSQQLGIFHHRVVSETNPITPKKEIDVSNLSNCNLILFIGRRCSNKTLCYQRNFSSTHERISLEEWKKKDNLSIHATFKKIIKRLEKKKVVIDDTNLVKETRKSLIEKIKQSMPSCLVGALYFHCENPKLLEFQFYINQTMSFFIDRYHLCSNNNGASSSSTTTTAPLTLSSDGPFQSQSGSGGGGNNMEVLMDEKKSTMNFAPTRDEGFDTIIHQPVKLTILNRDRIEFNHQGLIVDGLILAHSMFVDSDSDSSGPLSHLCWIFTQWMKIKPNGRIIVLLIERDFEKLRELFKSKTTFEHFHKNWLPKILCKYFSFPIYTVQIPTSNFSQLKRDETLLFSTLFYYQSLAVSESLVLTSPFISQCLVQLNTVAATRHKKFFKQECNIGDDSTTTLYFNNDLYFKMSKIGLLLLDFSSISEVPLAEINTIQMEQKFALCQLDYRTNQPTYFKQIEFVQYNDWKPEGKSISKFIGRFPLVQDLIAHNNDDENNFSIGLFKDAQRREIKSLLFGIILDPRYTKQFHTQNDFNSFVQYYQRINEYSVSNQMNYAIESMNDERRRFSPKQTSRLSKSLEGSPSSSKTHSSPSSSSSSSSTTTTAKSTTTTTTTTPDGKTSDIYQFPVTDMSVSAICDYFGLMTFQKGRDMEAQVYDVMVKLIPEKPHHFKMYTKCSSATEKDLVYRNEILMKQGKIIKGICTCPIGSQGKCKHVCASIMSYVSIVANRNVGNEEKIEDKLNAQLSKTNSLPHCSQTESQLSESKIISQDPPPPTFFKPEVPEYESEQEPKKKKTLPSWMGSNTNKEKSQKSSSTSSTKTDSNSLKKPKTSFFLYCDEYREAVKEELGGKIPASEVAKELGARWKKLSDEEKQVYIEKHKALSNEYSEKKKEMKATEESTSVKKEKSGDKKKKTIKKESIDNDPIQESSSSSDNDESFGNIFFSKTSSKRTTTKSNRESEIDSSIKPTATTSTTNISTEEHIVKSKSQPKQPAIVKKEMDDESFGNIFFSKPSSSKPTTIIEEQPKIIHKSTTTMDIVVKPEPKSPGAKKRNLPTSGSPVKPATILKHKDPGEDDESSDDEDAGSIFFSSSISKKKKPNLEETTTVRSVKSTTINYSSTTLEKKVNPSEITTTAMEESDSDEDASTIFFSKKTNVSAKEKTKSPVIISKPVEKNVKVGDKMEENDSSDEDLATNIFFSKQTKKKPHDSQMVMKTAPTAQQQPGMANKAVVSSSDHSTPSESSKKNDDSDDDEDVSFANIFFSKSVKKQQPTHTSNPQTKASSTTKSDNSTTTTTQESKDTKKVTSLKAMMAEFEF